MEPIAHRGCGAHGPENTVRAVVAAAARLPAVEVDVRRCGSGEVVTFHDERVDDHTDGTGRVADLPYATLRELGVDGTDEPIPLFADVVDAVPAGVTLQVELKEPGLALDVRGTLAEQDRSKVRLSSFSAPALAEVARSDWDPETGLLFGDAPAANIDLAAVLRCENVHPHTDLCLDGDVVERAREQGFRVFAWGLSETTSTDDIDGPTDVPPDADSTGERFRALASRGVDGVTVDTWELPDSR